MCIRVDPDHHSGEGMDGKDSFDAFYQDSYAHLVRQLWAVTGNRQDAEDVVQEAFVRAAARWGRISAYDLPEAWVRQVAIRLASNELRRVRRGLAALLRLRARPAGRPVGGPASAGDRLARPTAALPAGVGAALPGGPASPAGRR